MSRAIGLSLCFSLFVFVTTQSRLPVAAQTINGALLRLASRESAKLPQLPVVDLDDFRPLVALNWRYDFLPPPFALANDTGALLESAITKRLGIRYRFYGIDDTGYDCSGFVWRVFRDAGADFQRVAARTLWRQLPEATETEVKQFGTLVFFNGLKHIGIVRDAYSFYHASRSQGVSLSYFSGYWGQRITGFRRAPKELVPAPPTLTRNTD